MLSLPNGDILQGDCRATLKTLPEQSVNCCVTSPPYWGLRSYMPDKVQLRKDLSEQERRMVMTELAKIGVEPQ